MKKIILRHKRLEHVGLYAKACDAYAVAGEIDSPHLYNSIKQFADKIVKIDVLGSPAVTFFTAFNSNGIIFPFFVEKRVIQLFRKQGLSVSVYKGNLTALGNLVAANDRKAICSTLLSKSDIIAISDCLGVECLQLDLGQYLTPGSLIVVTNKGLCISPFLREKKEEIEEFFGISGEITTVNMGSGYLHIGMVANSKGALVGTKTTGFEMGRIENALDLIQVDNQ